MAGRIRSGFDRVRFAHRFGGTRSGGFDEGVGACDQYRVLDSRLEPDYRHVRLARFRPRPVGERLRTRRASATSRHNQSNGKVVAKNGSVRPQQTYGPPHRRRNSKPAVARACANGAGVESSNRESVQIVENSSNLRVRCLDREHRRISGLARATNPELADRPGTHRGDRNERFRLRN